MPFWVTGDLIFDSQYQAVEHMDRKLNEMPQQFRSLKEARMYIEFKSDFTHVNAYPKRCVDGYDITIDVSFKKLCNNGIVYYKFLSDILLSDNNNRLDSDIINIDEINYAFFAILEILTERYEGMKIYFKIESIQLVELYQIFLRKKSLPNLYTRTLFSKMEKSGSRLKMK